MFRGGRSRSSLISYPPTICLSNLVRKLKTISSLKIRQEFFNQIRRMLWGKRFWTKIIV
ncbi:transposase [Parasutterella excrementihominis]|uniref:transposase n=1 Tax=Parasutterella excrementihominis TaxID=487175 RepID=UPI003463BB3D